MWQSSVFVLEERFWKMFFSSMKIYSCMIKKKTIVAWTHSCKPVVCVHAAIRKRNTGQENLSVIYELLQKDLQCSWECEEETGKNQQKKDWEPESYTITILEGICLVSYHEIILFHHVWWKILLERMWSNVHTVFTVHLEKQKKVWSLFFI